MTIEQELLDEAHDCELVWGDCDAVAVMRRASALLGQRREALEAVQMEAISVFGDHHQRQCQLCAVIWATPNNNDNPNAHAPDCPMRLVSAALKELGHGRV